MKTPRAIIFIAMFAALGGCVYEPAYVRRAPYNGYYDGGTYVEEGYGYSPGYYHGPPVSVGIRYDNWHRDKRYHRGWRDRHGHWHR